MPFTFSHPAIVLPLKKIKPTWFSPSGLIMGSMAPDFQYFLKMDARSDLGHTPIGVFMIDLPLSFLVAIAFHLWVRNILIRHLPSPLDKKYHDSLEFNFLGFLRRRWLLFTISAIIGVMSHLIWDDFAKPDSWVYSLAPSFFSQTVHVGPLKGFLYDLIERMGSVLGLLFFAWVIFQKKEQAPMPAPLSSKTKSGYWASVALGASIIVGVKLVIDKGTFTLGHFIVVLCSAGLIAIVFTSMLYHVLKPHNTK